tara:strand:- start:1498 stop:2313 length:816 start_codon:yes stop_codon:yes gene_type:complete
LTSLQLIPRRFFGRRVERRKLDFVMPARSSDGEKGTGWPRSSILDVALVLTSAGSRLPYTRDMRGGRALPQPAGRLRPLGTALLLVLLSVPGAAQLSDLAQAAGVRLEAKLTKILDFSQVEGLEPRLTVLEEDEINAYLAQQGVPLLPEGLTQPELTIGDDDRVDAAVVVDLDRIRESRSRSWLDPLQYLGGLLPITASGRVRSADGLAHLEIDSVAIDGVPVPISVLRELVQHYTRTLDHPSGTRIDEPLPLPYGIVGLRLAPGRAVVVQ